MVAKLILESNQSLGWQTIVTLPSVHLSGQLGSYATSSLYHGQVARLRLGMVLAVLLGAILEHIKTQIVDAAKVSGAVNVDMFAEEA